MWQGRQTQRLRGGIATPLAPTPRATPVFCPSWFLAPVRSCAGPSPASALALVVSPSSAARHPLPFASWSGESTLCLALCWSWPRSCGHSFGPRHRPRFGGGAGVLVRRLALLGRCLGFSSGSSSGPPDLPGFSWLVVAAACSSLCFWVVPTSET